MRRIATGMALALVAAGAPLAVGAQSASASTPVFCDPGIYYNFSKVSSVWEPTNVYSAWLGPGTDTTYTVTKTGTWTATGTATVGADAGVLFASASSSFSLAVGKSWAKATTWSYHGGVPASSKVDGRLMMYHLAKAFTVAKTSRNNLCKTTKTYYTLNIVAPVASSDNNYTRWGIQYK